MPNEQQGEQKVIQIEDPVLIVEIVRGNKFQITVLGPKEWGSEGYQVFGIGISDIVRNVAAAYGVEEDAVWEWVDKERYHHTSEIQEVKPQ